MQVQEVMNLPEEFSTSLSGQDSRQKLFLTLSRANLENTYNEHGYFNCSVTLSDTTIAPSTAKSHIVTIREGEVFKYSNIELDIPDSAKLLIQYEDFSVYPLKLYNQNDIVDDLSLITRRYRENGYLHIAAQHFLLVDTIKSTIALIYRVTPGSLVKFGSLEITNRRGLSYKEASKNVKGFTSKEFLTSLWEKQPGEIINNNYLDVFRLNLLSTRLFSQVTLKDSLKQNDSDELSTIYLSTVEKVPGSLKLRLFYERIYGLGTTGEVRYRNFFGRFHEGWSSITYAQNKQRAAIGYANPLFFNNPIRFENEVSIQKDSLVDFSRSTLTSRESFIIQNRGSLSRRLSEYVRLKGQVKLKNQLKLVVDGDPKADELTIKFESFAFFDFVDLPISPENGARFIYTIGNGGEFDFDNRYTYSSIESKWYKRISKYVQLSAALDYGRFFNKSSNSDDFRSYFQGGDKSVRGIEVGAIYPKIPINPSEDDEEVKQPSYVRSAAEVRLTPPFSALKNTQLVPYFDWATVWDPRRNNSATIGAALGLGLRYKIQVLTIRLDYSFKTDFSKPFDKEPWESQRLVFDLMQAI